MELNVNKKMVSVKADPATPLLWVLRDELHLTGTKFGCGVAACGACTVRVDGESVRSCVMPLAAMAGRQVQTIEGLGTRRSARVATARTRPRLRMAALSET